MVKNPMDIPEQFPVRKNKKQKAAFRDAVQSYAQQMGYSVSVEKGSFGCQNIVIGDPETAKYLITAHYDTPARLPFPNLITPCNFWAFMGYQLFTVVAMFAFLIVFDVLLVLITNNPEIPFQISYLAMWVFLFLMLFGPANPSNANDNTSGVVTVLETARTMPENQRRKVCFVLFDLEEAGLIGSAAYRKAHKKASDHQIVLNLDCVGEGDEIVFFPTKQAKKQEKLMSALKFGCGWFGQKNISVHEKGFGIYPSDQKNFPLGVGIAAFRRSKWAGLYLSRIHTPKDTILEETNVNLLRACLTTLISNDAV